MHLHAHPFGPRGNGLGRWPRTGGWPLSSLSLPVLGQGLEQTCHKSRKERNQLHVPSLQASTSPQAFTPECPLCGGKLPQGGRLPACPPDAPLFTNHCQLLGRGRGQKPSPTAGPLLPVSVLATGPSDAMSCWPGRSHHLPRNASPHPQIPKVPKSEDPMETISSGNAPTPKDAGGRGGLCPLSLPWPQGPRGPRPTSSHWP